MDYNVTRLVEMFEARFGRHLTTAFIGLISFALICISIKTIVETIWPIVGLVREAVTGHPEIWKLQYWSQKFLRSDVSSVIITIIVWFFFSRMMRRNIDLHKRIKNQQKINEEHIRRLEEQNKENEQQTYVVKELERINEEHLRDVNKKMEILGISKDSLLESPINPLRLSPPIPAPPDTPAKK